ncbi:hypothetical protein [Guptibacillus hwajinpoensis]|uniref:hypothetical protein n=1 Tax=Guptibacillus hwajinpoensis TaxID=208199 RepID=UPI001CFDD65C|nr:hypothetical protein [Pseudalkalibacillus hwajinpoensis]WLR61531.1 hypothetical protein LC071_09710 [Pseudalkalibacillus hwajinpoensis]
MLKHKVLYLFLALGLVLAACGQSNGNSANENASDEKSEQSSTEKAAEENGEEKEEDADFISSFEEGKTELEKASEGEEVDYQAVIDLYNNDLQPLVEQREGEMDQQISSALEAGKSGDLDGEVVKQIYDKLMQKVFYLTVKHEFDEVKENWGNTEEVNKEIEEAKEYYEVLKGTVEKRDAAYDTSMVSQIDGAFSDMEAAVENDDNLQFVLGTQMVDKTLMKTFYLATGALPEGYATKAAKEAKEDPEHARVEQAEGWAFYQSISNYVMNHAEEDAALIEKNFSLENDVKEIDPEAVNHAFIRGFSKVALHEYEESEEEWGEDKSTITALEGALFIDMISSDIKRMEGEEAYNTLSAQAQSYLEAVKSDEKEKAMEELKEIKETLNMIINKAE